MLSQGTFTDRTLPDSNEFKPFFTKSIKNDVIVIGVDMTSHVCQHSVETIDRILATIHIYIYGRDLQAPCCEPVIGRYDI